MTIATLIATVGAGLFAGASVYITVAEHPARLECGPALGVREFGPSYRRAAFMQGGLAVACLLAGLAAWWQGSGAGWLIGGLLLGGLVPFTLIVIMPTNRRLLDPGLDPGSVEAGELLSRWGRFHAVRTLVGVAVFVAFAGMSLRAPEGAAGDRRPGGSTMTSLSRSRTLTVSIDCPPERVHAFASNPENFPKWASSFVKSVKRVGTEWVAETTEGPVGIRFVPENEFGVLDHVATPAPGVEIRVPMRVVPNGSGSEVVFTLYQQPGMSDERFDRDTGMVERDLRTLKRLLETR